MAGTGAGGARGAGRTNPSPATRTIISPTAPTAVIHLEVPCLLPTDASFIGELGAHDAEVETSWRVAPARRAVVAIVSPKSVAERAVHRDVKQPRQGADQEQVRDQPEDRESGQSEWSPEAMNEVVNRHRPGMQLSLREVTTAAVEQREVRANSKNGDLPVARVGDRVGGDPD